MRKFSELSIMERKYTFNDKPLRRPIDKFLNKAYRIDDEKRVKSRYIYLVEEMTWLSNRAKEFNDMMRKYGRFNHKNITVNNDFRTHAGFIFPGKNIHEKFGDGVWNNKLPFSHRRMYGFFKYGINHSTFK